MIRDNCSKIGYITKPHGIDGSVVVRLNGLFADDIEPGEPMFIEIDGTLVPFFIEEIRPQTDMAYIKFGFVDSEKDAGKLRTFSLYTYHEKSHHQPFQLSWAALCRATVLLMKTAVFQPSLMSISIILLIRFFLYR